MKLDALQQAVYDRLTGYAGVNDAVTGVYTSVPQDPISEDESAFPYITISFPSVLPDDTKTDNGISALVGVHIWARSYSSLTWRAIAGDVYDALQKYDGLDVEGANVIDCRFSSEVDYPDPDGATHHQETTFKVDYRFD